MYPLQFTPFSTHQFQIWMAVGFAVAFIVVGLALIQRGKTGVEDCRRNNKSEQAEIEARWDIYYGYMSLGMCAAVVAFGFLALSVPLLWLLWQFGKWFYESFEIAIRK